MSSVPAYPTLDQLADLAHGQASIDSNTYALFLSLGDTSAAVGSWACPSHLKEPLSCLIGFRAKPEWDVVGWSSQHFTHEFLKARPGEHMSNSGRLTVIMDRHGTSTLSVDQESFGCLKCHPDPLVDDILARCLDLATPGPVSGPAAWIDAAWVDLISTAAYDGTSSLTWAELSKLHPLHGRGEAKPAAELRSRNVAFGENGWSFVRQRWLGPARHNPPGASLVPERDWFDDGSFARWLSRGLPETEEMMTDLSLMLPAPLFTQLCSALVPESW